IDPLVTGGQVKKVPGNNANKNFDQGNGNSGPDRHQAGNERERHPDCGDEPNVLKNNVRRTEAEPNVIKHNKTPACALLREQESLALKPVSAVFPAGAGALHKLANDYYNWRNENDPVSSSNAGLHTWDDRLADFSPAKIAERAQHVRALLDKVRSMKIDTWPKDEQIDAILFRAQLENVDFQNRVLKFERTNPQTYIGECVSAIFSLLKKEYDTPRKRALSATARLKAMPPMLKQGLTNLQNPVKLYAKLAIDSARSIDPLLKD